jgi:DNA-binding MarR family transcriptional regulator
VPPGGTAQHRDPARAQDLRLAVGRVARRLRQLYAAHDAAGPTFTEVAVLAHLRREGPSSPTELAASERVTSQAIALVVGELEKKGLVARTVDPADRRRRILTVTPAGVVALHDREAVLLRRLTEALDGAFDDADREALDRAVPLMNRLADTL